MHRDGNHCWIPTKALKWQFLFIQWWFYVVYITRLDTFTGTNKLCATYIYENACHNKPNKPQLDIWHKKMKLDRFLFKHLQHFEITLRLGSHGKNKAPNSRDFGPNCLILNLSSGRPHIFVPFEYDQLWRMFDKLWILQQSRHSTKPCKPKLH